MNEFVSTGVVLGMALEVIITAGLPILLLALWYSKTKTSLLPALGGAVVFFVSVKILESILHYFCLMTDSPVSRAITGSVWTYALYAGLAAGIFEETGRLICFKVMKKHRDRETAITYGIGHGGFESMSLVAMTMIIYITIAISMNISGGASAYMAKLSEEQAVSIGQVVATILSISGAGIFWGSFERVVAICLQIAMSVFVFAAVAGGRGKRWMFPAAILIHAAADILPAMYQYGKVKNIATVELAIAAYTVVVCVLAYMIYKKLNTPAAGEENSAESAEIAKEAHNDKGDSL